MRLVVHTDDAIAKFDPMRIASPQIPGEPQFAVRMRIGPDWFALAGNWMTEWERTEYKKWRDRILAGVDSILAMEYWLQTGQQSGLNPDIPGGAIGPLRGGGGAGCRLRSCDRQVDCYSRPTLKRSGASQLQPCNDHGRRRSDV